MKPLKFKICLEKWKASEQAFADVDRAMKNASKSITDFGKQLAKLNLNPKRNEANQG